MMIFRKKQTKAKKSPFKFFKGYLPDILLGPFLNTLSHLTSSLRGIERWQLRSASEQMRTKRSYGNRELQIENGSFTTLVFATNGGMGTECIRFYKRLPQIIADKRKAPISIVTNSIRNLICFLFDIL